MLHKLYVPFIILLIPTLVGCASGPETAGEAAEGANAPAQAFVRTEAEAAHRVTPPETAAAYVYGQGENAALARLIIEPGVSVPEHRDATEEYIYVLEGHGVITIDGERFEVASGSLIFMPANARVSYDNGDERFVGIQVFAGPAPIEKYDGWKSGDDTAAGAAQSAPESATKIKGDSSVDGLEAPVVPVHQMLVAVAASDVEAFRAAFTPEVREAMDEYGPKKAMKAWARGFELGDDAGDLDPSSLQYEFRQQAGAVEVVYHEKSVGTVRVKETDAGWKIAEK